MSTSGMVNGTAGNNTITGGTGDNDYYAGKGNDYITDKGGNDTYHFYKGDGSDTISDSSGKNELIFEDLEWANADFSTEGNDLVIKFKAAPDGTTFTGDQVTIKNWLLNPKNKIDTIYFPVNKISYVTKDIDTSFDSSYSFKKGDGASTITDSAGNDTIFFGENIALDDLAFSRKNNDMIIKYSQNDQITIKEWYSSVNNRIENIVFDKDGALDMTKTIIGDSLSNKNDKLSGTSDDNVFFGGKGNDLINDTLGGNDLYMFNTGDGNDTITDIGGTDTIRFGDSITVADLAITQKSGNLYIKIGNKGDSITLNKYYSGAIVETLLFHDGSSINTSKLVVGNASANVLTGTASDNMYYPNGGNDTIFDTAGNDTISFASGLIPDYKRDGSDLIINFEGHAGDSVRVKDWFLTDWLSDKRTFTLLEQGSGDIITASDIMSVFESEVFNGDSLNNIEYGSSNNDFINLKAGNDTIEAGEGNDYIYDSAGNDLYVYNFADGNDIINDLAGNDTISFTDGITPESIIPFKIGNDLKIAIYNIDETGLPTLTDKPDEAITIKDWFVSDAHKIETLKFSDGETYNLANLKLGTIGNDNIKDTSAADNVYFTINGTDKINDSVGNDTYFSTLLAGNLNIIDGSGNDIYRFVGDNGAKMTINDNSGNDTLIFEDDNIENLKFSKTGNDLTLTAGYTVGSKTYHNQGVITIKDYFNDKLTNKIEHIQFKDGTIIDFSSINIGANNNTVSNTDTLFIGKSGNNKINGGNGNDTYVYAIGDGNDTISDSNGNDTLIVSGKADIANIGNIKLNKSLSGNDLLIKFGADAEILTIADWFTGKEYKIETLELPDGTCLNNFNNIVLDDNSSNNLVDNDSLDNIYYGKQGNDSISDAGGNDFYLYGIGDGADTITDSAGNDTIQFMNGITERNLAFTRSDDNLNIAINGASSGDSITIADWYGSSDNKIEKLRFTDGSVISADKIEYIVNHGDSVGFNENAVYGTDNSEYIAGTSGNDTIYAKAGDDTVNSGRGNDYIEDSSGNDTYIYNLGDSTKVILDQSGNDTIMFGNNIAPDNLEYTRYQNNLVIEVNNMHDKLIIENYFASADNQVENLKFAGNDTPVALNSLLSDITVWDSLTGTNLDDILPGSTGDDTIAGGRGNDFLEGNTGNDTYIFNSGDGSDRIFDEAGNDTIKLGDGITKDDLMFKLMPSETAGCQDLMIFFSNSADSITIEEWKNTSGEDHKIENIDFTDLGQDPLSIAEIQYAIAADGTMKGYNSAFTYGMVSSDSLNGTDGDDTIFGFGGNDTINGNLGDDILNGGIGNDFLYGGFGSDSYLFKLGDGHDVIQDTAGESDKIILDSKVNKAKIAIFKPKSGNDVIIDYGTKAGSDQITIKNDSGTGAIEKLQCGSYYLTDSDIQKISSYMVSYAVKHHISISSVNDVRKNSDLMAYMSHYVWHK